MGFEKISDIRKGKYDEMWEWAATTDAVVPRKLVAVPRAANQPIDEPLSKSQPGAPHSISKNNWILLMVLIAAALFVLWLLAGR